MYLFCIQLPKHCSLQNSKTALDSLYGTAWSVFCWLLSCEKKEKKNVLNRCLKGHLINVQAWQNSWLNYDWTLSKMSCYVNDNDFVMTVWKTKWLCNKMPDLVSSVCFLIGILRQSKHGHTERRQCVSVFASVQYTSCMYHQLALSSTLISYTPFRSIDSKRTKLNAQCKRHPAFLISLTVCLSLESCWIALKCLFYLHMGFQGDLLFRIQIKPYKCLNYYEF